MSTTHQNPSFIPPLAPRPRRRPMMWIMTLGGLVGVLALSVYVSGDNASLAKKGDCVVNEGTVNTPSMSIADCSDSSAQYKVLDILSDTADSSGCRNIAGVQTAYTYQSKTKKIVLCLGAAR